MNHKNIYVLLFLIFFSSLQYLLLIKHKSPYLSDSYFYLHSYNLYRGLDAKQSFQNIKQEVFSKKIDSTTEFIFSSEQNFNYSYTFFQKRLLYPFIAVMLSLFSSNPFWNFFVINFLSYLAVVTSLFLLLLKYKNLLFATLICLLLVLFYPYLDWSTYFLTDNLGTFFWILNLYFLYKYLKSGMNRDLFLIFLTFIVSLMNREQNILILPLVILVTTFLKINKSFLDIKKRILKPLIGISFICLIYVLILALTGQKNIIDTINYNYSNYGIAAKADNYQQLLSFWFNSIIDFHQKFATDLISRHGTLVFAIFSVVYINKLFRIDKKAKLMDVIMLASLIASYLFVFIFPVFSYRYYYPLIISVIYFGVSFVNDFFKIEKESK